ncbi:MAG TPA: hypothetical protein VFN56_01925 [Candidatus Saccharimonadales bacterium]|nr:hypothetical protein [Candidatus Saccharimonadales bacterium]
MTRQDIVSKVQSLDPPVGHYVLFGSCPLAAAGIREASDKDMVVSHELLETLKARGWRQVV